VAPRATVARYWQPEHVVEILRMRRGLLLFQGQMKLHDGTLLKWFDFSK